MSKQIRNYTVIAMAVRYSTTTKTMKDRRLKRKNRKSWKKDIED